MKDVLNCTPALIV